MTHGLFIISVIDYLAQLKAHKKRLINTVASANLS